MNSTYGKLRTKEERDAFVTQIAGVINSRSDENRSNTPDFMLAEIAVSAIEAYEKQSVARENWYNKKLSIL
jgi:hypothetical protein